MARSKAKRPCPCGSGESYAACCRPVHQGARTEAPSALVRARFSAFALGEGAFLLATVAKAHPLTTRPKADVVRELSQAHKTLRYRAVEIRDERVDGASAQVLFCARVFEKGKDRSFVELSNFVREQGWVYADGLLASHGTAAAEAMSIETYLAAFSPA
ncbi:MAG: YchJ family protein [Sandaracinaceae bacterium]